MPNFMGISTRLLRNWDVNILFSFKIQPINVTDGSSDRPAVYLLEGLDFTLESQSIGG